MSCLKKKESAEKSQLGIEVFQEKDEEIEGFMWGKNACAHEPALLRCGCGSASTGDENAERF